MATAAVVAVAIGGSWCEIWSVPATPIWCSGHLAGGSFAICTWDQQNQMKGKNAAMMKDEDSFLLQIWKGLFWVGKGVSPIQKTGKFNLGPSKRQMMTMMMMMMMMMVLVVVVVVAVVVVVVVVTMVSICEEMESIVVLNKQCLVDTTIWRTLRLPLRNGGRKKKLLSETKSSQHVLKSGTKLKNCPRSTEIFSKTYWKRTRKVAHVQPISSNHPTHPKALAAHALLTSRPRSSRSTRAVPRAVPRIVRRAVELAPTAT